MYVNNNWCTNTVTIDSHCCPNLEYLTVKCRPFYLPHEFTAVLTTVVYIAPVANAKLAIRLLHGSISSQLSRFPDAVHIIAGDFKSAPIITKTVKTRPDDASQQLQDCFDRTNWDIFAHQDLNVFTDSVLCYIKHCTDTVTVDKRLRIYPNQKP